MLARQRACELYRFPSLLGNEANRQLWMLFQLLRVSLSRETSVGAVNHITNALVESWSWAVLVGACFCQLLRSFGACTVVPCRKSRRPKKDLVEMDSRALVRRASRARHQLVVHSRKDHLSLLSSEPQPHSLQRLGPTRAVFVELMRVPPSQS